MFRLPGSSKEPNYNLQETYYSGVIQGGSRKEWKFRSDKHLRLCANLIYMHYDHQLDGTTFPKTSHSIYHPRWTVHSSTQMAAVVHFPAPVGGTPLSADWVPSILFAVLYAMILPLTVYRMAHRRSRTLLLLGTVTFSIER